MKIPLKHSPRIGEHGVIIKSGDNLTGFARGDTVVFITCLFSSHDSNLSDYYNVRNLTYRGVGSESGYGTDEHIFWNKDPQGIHDLIELRWW